uniref:Stabilin 2 n=1 Tax=Cynoglossus semilaevis TaxID=244447 RepID=A0A3P8UTH8_CYNSE
ILCRLFLVRQNICSNSTVLRTRTSCHSCSISVLIPCRTGYKQTPGSMAQDCSLKVSLSGCSFECYREAEVKNCCPGFWGPDCIDCPESAETPCSGRGICSDGLGGNGNCTCQSGFAGTACEDCSPGRYGPTCSSECTCLHGLCNSGLNGDGQCTCFSGYRGPRCDQEIPECTALRCPQGSRCMEEALTGKLVCQCSPGYQKSGDQCLPVNPCLRQPCHVHASCVHTGPNQHLCACHEGYSGDGRICMAVDPCQIKQGGCDSESAKCVYDGPGKSHCECLSGFDHLSAGACRLKELCRPGSCHVNANCTTAGPEQVECTCLQGYVGNGKVCYGNIMERLNELNTEPGGQWTGQLSNAISLFGSVSWPLRDLGPLTVKSRKPLIKEDSQTSAAKYLCKLHLVAGVMPFEVLKKTDVFYTLTGKTAETDAKKGTIVQSNIVASNGMIHLINNVMDSVVATVDSDPKVRFNSSLFFLNSPNSRYAYALVEFTMSPQATDLTSVMDLPGPMTVFIPTSSAFDAMTEGYMDYLTSEKGRNKLVELLRNHIVTSTSLDIFNAISSPRIVTTANQVLTINVTDNGQVLVNGAAVLEAAVEAKNGRLYVLDGVLIPSSIEPVLPHRCDIINNITVMVRVIVVSNCCIQGIYHQRCFYQSVEFRIPREGCALLCKATVTTAACCQGFYGEGCSPCPGGHQTPCSGHGQCSDGLTGNGTCICNPNFSGSRCQYCSSTNKYGPNCDKTCLCIHGVCDNRPDSKGQCKRDTCLTGFTGPLCEQQTAVCGQQAKFCHAHADCVFSQRTTQCVCKPGYQGDGITCVESDPCAPPLRGGCSVNAKCMKTGPNKHVCQCLTGWREDGDDCQPINNCNDPDRGGCHSNATCIYVGPGQSDCSCKAGYKGNGQECEAVNQCVTTSGGCHYLATCHLLLSEWTCVCDDGYVGNGQICYGTVGQDSGVSLSDQNITLLVPTSDAVGKMSSEDKAFWTMSGNLPMVILLMPKMPLMFTMSCMLTVLIVLLMLMPFHPQVLVPDRKLSEGLLTTLAQRPEFSLFRSYLINYNLTDVIEQANEFTIFAPTDGAINEYLKKMSITALDMNTTRFHVVIDERLLKTDLQSGSYKETLLGFSYQVGIFPRDGKIFVNDAQINSSNLLAGKGVIHGLSSVLPLINGSCVECLFSKTEFCPKDTQPVVRRGNSFMFLQLNGFCSHTERQCCSGFFGAHCEPCPGPKGEPCFNKGVCLDGTNGTGVCQCNQGFNGTACETCQTGKYGVHCDQDCKCKSGRCKDGLTGDGTCECDVGWRGILCDEKLVSSADELCGSFKCHTSANCVIGPLGSQCICAAGFDGNGTFCQARDACATNNGGCSPDAVCKRTQPGRRDCICNSGFTGDGLVCVEINPCLHGNGGCHENAECIHVGPNKTSCVCSTGYTGNGLNKQQTLCDFLQTLPPGVSNSRSAGQNWPSGSLQLNVSMM